MTENEVKAFYAFSAIFPMTPGGSKGPGHYTGVSLCRKWRLSWKSSSVSPPSA